MKIFIDFSKLSDGMTDCPRNIISKIICLLNKQRSNDFRNVYFLCGSMNKDGNTYLPFDSIANFKCDCPDDHEFHICSKVDHVFYAVKLY